MLFHIFGQIFTKVGTRIVQHNLFSDCDFYENRLSKTHTLFWGVNEFLLPVSFTAWFRWNSVCVNYTQSCSPLM